MRSWLSTLWIVIWMTSVIVMMAIWQWTEESLMKNMQDMIKNKITVSSEWWYSQWNEEKDKPWWFIKKVTFTKKTIELLEEYFPELKWKITFKLEWKSWEVKIWRNKQFVSTAWIPKNFLTLNEFKLEEWTSFTDDHYNKFEYVAIINNSFKKDLFKWQPALWKKFMLQGKEYTIIWVLQKSQMDFSPIAYLPDTTVSEKINRKKELSSFEIFLDAKEDNTIWKNRITYFLMKYYNKIDKQTAWFSVSSFADFTEQLKKSSNMMKYFLLFVWWISLLVWWIWVMNIMIVSVTERTREIWIRKAIWALNVDIILQFLIESVVITLLWWIIAFILSYWVVHFINSSMQWSEEWIQAVIDQKTALVSFCLTAWTWILFWILPARKAAKLKPIDALRFE